MEASVLDLRKNMSKVMSAINRCERVTLTHRGRRKAVIVPFAEEKQSRIKVADLPAFGMWKDREDLADVETVVRQMREPRRF